MQVSRLMPTHPLSKHPQFALCLKCTLDATVFPPLLRLPLLLVLSHSSCFCYPEGPFSPFQHLPLCHRILLCKDFMHSYAFCLNLPSSSPSTTFLLLYHVLLFSQLRVHFVVVFNLLSSLGLAI